MSEIRPQRRTIKGPPKELWEFLGAVVFCVFLPLLPVFLEFIFSGVVSVSSILITGVMYTLGIATAFNNKPAFIFGTLIAAIIAVGYGASLTFDMAATLFPEIRKDPSNWNMFKDRILETFYWISTVAIFILGTLHIFQRYNKHWCNLEAFFDFGD